MELDTVVPYRYSFQTTENKYFATQLWGQSPKQLIVILLVPSMLVLMTQIKKRGQLIRHIDTNKGSVRRNGDWEEACSLPTQLWDTMHASLELRGNKLCLMNGCRLWCCMKWTGNGPERDNKENPAFSLFLDFFGLFWASERCDLS